MVLSTVKTHTVEHSASPTVVPQSRVARVILSRLSDVVPSLFRIQSSRQAPSLARQPLLIRFLHGLRPERPTTVREVLPLSLAAVNNPIAANATVWMTPDSDANKYRVTNIWNELTKFETVYVRKHGSHTLAALKDYIQKEILEASRFALFVPKFISGKFERRFRAALLVYTMYLAAHGTEPIPLRYLLPIFAAWSKVKSKRQSAPESLRRIFTYARDNAQSSKEIDQLSPYADAILRLT